MATTGFAIGDGRTPYWIFTVEAGEVAPPGLCTVRLSVPLLAARLPGIVAVTDVAVLAVTVNAVVPE